jgi:hypothetical protein
VTACRLRKSLYTIILLLQRWTGLPSGRQGFCNRNVEIIFLDEIRRYSQQKMVERGNRVPGVPKEFQR